jgi:1-acyl-sn-glycerol-3-phosphate acyltransferase
VNGVWLALFVLGVAAFWFARRFITICERASRADWGGRWLNRLDGLNRLFCRGFHGLPDLMLPLPKSGPALVASNHVSGLDPLLLIAASARPLRFIIAREQYERWWLRWLFRAVGCIPVDRRGDTTAALYAARRALAKGEVVALFPYGRILLDDEPAPPLKGGVVLLSQLTGAPIIPVRIRGVRGQGYTVRAVFMRSRAHIERQPLLTCVGRAPEECLAELRRALQSDASMSISRARTYA